MSYNESGKSLQIKRYLLRGGSLTHLQAIAKFRHSRLSSVVCRMREDGIDVITLMISKNGSRFASYYVNGIA